MNWRYNFIDWFEIDQILDTNAVWIENNYSMYIV